MLDGIRILDLSEEPGFLAGKILGDLGADVVKLEPPGGDRFGRRGPYLGRDRRSRAQPALARAQHQQARHHAGARDAARARAVRALAARADVVLETAAPGSAWRRSASAGRRFAPAARA